MSVADVKEKWKMPCLPPRRLFGPVAAGVGDADFLVVAGEWLVELRLGYAGHGGTG